MAVVKELIYSLIFRDRDIAGAHVKPVLDGAFSSNRKLDRAQVLDNEITAPDDILPAPDGKFYVSSGETIRVFKNEDFVEPRLFASLDAQVGGLGWSGDGHLLACVAGRGVCMLSEEGTVIKCLESVEGEDLKCPTAITTSQDGTIFITNGSRHNPTDQWLQDLMANEEGSGRLVAWDTEINESRVVYKGLSWPAGAVVSHNQEEVWVTEAWAHKLCAVNRASGELRYIIDNYAGYPWRITQGAYGDYWLAFFALRSQLIDFVLRERDYCDKMMAQVPPEYWVGPALSSKSHYLHPSQYGRIKTLGVQKPWAPARSYGLIARLDSEGVATESFHSRVGGKVHGMTSVRCVGDRVIACSKGDDKILELVEISENHRNHQ